MSGDKQLTRWARMGFKRVLMWGSWHELRVPEPGNVIQAKYDRKNPRKSYLAEVKA